MDDTAVFRSLQRLAVVITKNEDPPLHVIQAAQHLVRPCATHTATPSHTNAIRLRLRDKLLGDQSGSPLLAAQLDKYLDILRQLKSLRWQSVLAVLEPLAFTAAHQATSMPTIQVAPQCSATDSYALSEEPAEESSCADIVNIPRRLMMKNTPQRSQLPNEEQLQLARHFSLDVLSEEKLLRDLLLVLQGLGGKHIKLDDKSGCYVLDPALGISAGVRDMVLRICEAGWLYQRINAYIRHIVGGATNGVSRHPGLAAQALAFALQETLQEYYQLLAVIEARLHTSLSSSAGSAGGVSLLLLQAWIQEPLERLTLMARIAETCSSLAGGSLASRLHSYTLHGADSTRKYSQTLMRAVCVPFYRMVVRWLLHGELIEDTKKEFIIQPPTAAATDIASKAGWHDAFMLHEAMVPSFVTTKLAHKILVVGKSIYFTKLCLRLLSNGNNKRYAENRKRVVRPSLILSEAESSGDGSSVFELPAIPESEAHDEVRLRAVDEAVAERLRSLQYGNEDKLAVIVSDISLVTDKRLLYLMDVHFHLSEHLIAMKKFLLLGQGDFVTCLMDMVGAELRKRASQLFRHNLTGILEGALRTCNAQYEPSYILDRLAVRLLEPSPGDSGWEIFSLEYIVDAPLTAVFHNSSILLYRTAFHHLWRLKRVEWTLASGWKTLMSLLHTRGHDSLRRLRPVFHRCALHRSKMTHLVNNLSNYMMFEVVEAAWLRLEEQLAASICLDEVIAAHDKYLADIEDRALLSAKHEAINMQIQTVMHSILRFCHLEETLVADALSVAARRRAAGGSAAEYADSPPGTVEGVPGYVIQRLEDSAIDYDAQFHKMMSMLIDQGERAGEIVRFLVFRLDYNEQQQQPYDIVPPTPAASINSNSIQRRPGVSTIPEDIDAAANESLNLSALRTPQHLRSDEEVRNKLLSMLHKK